MSYLTYREKEEIAYPSSDGKPFAENDLIFDYMAYSLETMNLEQVAQMMNLPTAEVERLVGRNQ